MTIKCEFMQTKCHMYTTLKNKYQRADGNQSKHLQSHISGWYHSLSASMYCKHADRRSLKWGGTSLTESVQSCFNRLINMRENKMAGSKEAGFGVTSQKSHGQGHSLLFSHFSRIERNSESADGDAIYRRQGKQGKETLFEWSYGKVFISSYFQAWLMEMYQQSRNWQRMYQSRLEGSFFFSFSFTSSHLLCSSMYITQSN